MPGRHFRSFTAVSADKDQISTATWGQRLACLRTTICRHPAASIGATVLGTGVRGLLSDLGGLLRSLPVLPVCLRAGQQGVAKGDRFGAG